MSQASRTDGRADIRLDGGLNDEASPGRGFFLAACVAVALQLAVALAVTKGIETAPPDALSYLLVARSLLDGQGYTVGYVDLHLGSSDAVRHVPEMHGLVQPFAFAAVLAALGEHLSVVRIPGFLYIAGAALGAFSLARRAFGPAAGLAACLLVSASLRLVTAATLGADDVGFAFFFTWMLVALHRALLSRRERDFAVAGLLAGLASTMKPLGLFQPLVFASLLVLWKPLGFVGLARRAVALALPFAALSSLYVVRNWFAHGGLGGRVSPLNVVQKTLGAEAVYRLYDPAPTLADVVAEVGPEALVASALRQLGRFLQSDVLAVFAAPTSAIGFLLWLPALLLPLSLFAFARLARQRRELAALYASTTLGAVGFVCILWHYEPRYLSLLIPLQAVMISGLLAPQARSAGWPGRLGAGLAGGAVLLGILGFAAFAWQAPALTRLVNQRGSEAGCGEAHAWIRAETEPGARILTFNPWELSWATRRHGIVLPSGGPDAIVATAERYQVDWLSLRPYPARGATLMHTRQVLAGGFGIQARLIHGGKACRVYRLERGAGR